jgi:OmpA-OmpF porin, OOP family
MNLKSTLLPLALGVALLGAGCPKPKVVTPPPQNPQPTTTAASAPASQPKPLSRYNPNKKFKVPVKSVKVDKDVLRLKEGVTVLFKTGSDEILAESHPLLDEVATVLEENKGLSIRVEGHTDDVGDDGKNLTLSEQRAASVKEYLVAWGIEDSRVTSAGCGEKAPVADNKTDDGKTKNRRVDFVIVGGKDVPTCQIYKAPTK